MKRNLAFVFPGQGSQTEGMLNGLETNPIVSAVLEEANDVVGYDLSSIILKGTKEELGKTVITQPAILTVSTALWRLWCSETEIRPAYVAGHSLGEYSALVASEVLSFKDAVQLVSKRAIYMQEAVAEGVGSMAAILGLEDEIVIALCEEAAQGEIVSAVNFNSPGQVVIAGEKNAVERASILAKEKGAKKVMPLSVSVPSHCMLMKPAADRLAQEMATVVFNTPIMSILHNVDVASHQTSDDIRLALTKQLYQPVRWTETIQCLLKNGADHIVECGPSKVLSGLNKRIDKTITSYNIDDFDHLHEVLNAIETV